MPAPHNERSERTARAPRRGKPASTVAAPVRPAAPAAGAAPAFRRAGAAPRSSMGAEVHAKLRAAIMDVRVRPGESLSENAIAEELQVSRTPVREAIQRLASEGLVQVVPQVGTRVAPLELGAIRDALFMREAVECTALARITARLPRADAERLAACVARHEQAIREHDLDAMLACDEAFHRALLELAGVPGAWRYVQQAREMHRRVRVLAQAGSDSAVRSAAQHRQIVRKLAAGQGAEAAELLRQHIRMNVEFAEDIARRHPEYFQDLAPARAGGRFA